MNVQLEPTLEQFVKDEDFKEIKESNLPSIKSPQETIISKPVEIKPQTILKKTLKVNKNSKEYHFVEKMGQKNLDFINESSKSEIEEIKMQLIKEKDKNKKLKDKIKILERDLTDEKNKNKKSDIIIVNLRKELENEKKI